MIPRSPSSNEVISSLTKMLLSISIASVFFCSSYAATTDFGPDEKASSPAASRFVLQLGQFDNEAAAKQSVDKLRSVGVPAYTVNRSQSDGSTRTLLRAGPFLIARRHQQCSSLFVSQGFISAGKLMPRTQMTYGLQRWLTPDQLNRHRLATTPRVRRQGAISLPFYTAGGPAATTTSCTSPKTRSW